MAASPMPTAIPIEDPSSAVMMLSRRTIRRTWRRVMPTARSIPISRVRSKVASTSVLASPKRLTITASASSTSKRASSWLMPLVCFSM
jgi:hypothetical protein